MGQVLIRKLIVALLRRSVGADVKQLLESVVRVSYWPTAQRRRNEASVVECGDVVTMFTTESKQTLMLTLR